MTIGMRQEKTNVLCVFCVLLVVNDAAEVGFQEDTSDRLRFHEESSVCDVGVLMTRINKSRLSPIDKEKVMQNQRQMEEQIQREAASNYGVPPPPPPPPPLSSFSSSPSSVPPPPPPPPSSSNASSGPAPSAAPEPKPHIPIYNPMAKRSTPVNAGTMDVPSSMIPTSVKKQIKEKAVTFNPFLSSLPVSDKGVTESEQKKEEEEDKINVPGPQLRFTLVPYGIEDSEDDSSDDVSSEEPKSSERTEEKESNEKPQEANKQEEKEEEEEEEEEKNDAFNQFMKEINSL